MGREANLGENISVCATENQSGPYLANTVQTVIQDG